MPELIALTPPGGTGGILAIIAIGGTIGVLIWGK